MKNIQIRILSLPPNTSPDEPIFAAGDFNRWQPADARFQFSKAKTGDLILEFPSPTDRIEFKITRGNWTTVETDIFGKDIENRIANGTGSLYKIRVESWADLPSPDEQSEIVLLHPEFYMPQLGRYRKIWALLPPGYHREQHRRYPVMYMQDGQNLFDNSDAVFGSWNADRALTRLFFQRKFSHEDGPFSERMTTLPIIIGIENGREHRLDEYAPWRNDEIGGGGAAGSYLDFLCGELKPFVDERLRTLPERAHTGVGGSSMGGLFALYAALERPDVFGLAGVFSPSLWFSRQVFELAKTKKGDFQQKILFMAGQQESATMVSDLLDLYETLLEAGHDDCNLHYDLHSDGLHAEWFWAREFEHALSWLIGDAKDQHFRGFTSNFIRFQQKEAEKQLLVSVSDEISEPLLEIRDYCHQRQFYYPLNRKRSKISYEKWENCLYSVRLLSASDLVFSRRLFL